MPEAFDVNQYWLNRGRSYVDEQRLYGPYHRLQESFLLDVICSGELPHARILELGCGFGRVTKVMAKHFPESSITALDLSADQLNNARHYCEPQRNISFATYDFYSGAPLPGERYDLGLAVEVFLHHPLELVSGIVKSLSSVCDCILNIDWSEPWPWHTPEHVWLHDYERIYEGLRLQHATFVLPEKVDRKQQKLFVAGKHLPPALLSLEQQRRKPDFHPVDPPEDWLQQLHSADADVRTAVPRGSICILVDGNHWGEARKSLHRPMLPFLERNGEYWGLPADGETAIREMDRMRHDGAEYIIFPWHEFWWFEHYKTFHEHLRVRFPCVAATENVVIYKLKGESGRGTRGNSSLQGSE